MIIVSLSVVIMHALTVVKFNQYTQQLMHIVCLSCCFAASLLFRFHVCSLEKIHHKPPQQQVRATHMERTMSHCTCSTYIVAAPQLQGHLAGLAERYINLFHVGSLHVTTLQICLGCSSPIAVGELAVLSSIHCSVPGQQHMLCDAFA